MGSGITDRDRGLAGNAVSQVIVDTLEQALALGKAGYKVFPVIENGKIPAIGGWQHRATSDEHEIRKLWTETDPVLGGTRVKPYNIGISTAGLLVLDVDTKDGKPGLKSLEQCDMIEGVPETYTVQTTSGGLHLYFKPGNPVGNSSSKIAPGLDVRGDGGYVLAPGSVIDGKAYHVVKPFTVADAPAWLERSAGAPTPRDASQKQVIDILDTPIAVQRVIDYLSKLEPTMTAGNAYTPAFATAARCKDFGVSELTTLTLMAEHWNGIKRIPPIEFEKLAFKVSNAYHYGKKPVGTESAQADFDKVDIEIPTSKPVPKHRNGVIYWDDEDNAPEPDPLIDGIMDKGSCVIVYGKPNVGKTFVTYAMARHIAAGAPWAGREVEKGAVLYVQCEGHSGVSRRRKALKRYFKDAGIPLAIVKATVNLVKSADDREWLRAMVDEVSARYGVPVVLAVIDTLSAAAPGMDENAAGDVSAALAAMKVFTCDRGITLAIVHHEGKNGNGGPRGSSAFVGNVDTVIHVQDGMISSDKMRESAKMDPIPFKLEVLNVGTTAKGRAVTSCVAIAYGAGERDFGKVPMNDFEKHMYDALLSLLAEGVEDVSGTYGISLETWRDRVKSVTKGFVTPPSFRKGWQRGVTGLRDKGYVRNNEFGQWVIEGVTKRDNERDSEGHGA